MRIALPAAALFLVACASTVDSVGEAQSALERDAFAASARVCSWNIRRLGHNFDGRPKDIATTARIIDDNCDIIAVQEVMQLSGAGTPGYASLGDELGPAWGGVRTDSPRPNTTAASAEHYAFYFRRAAASLCDGWIGIRYLPDDEDVFLREPAWACFKARAHAQELLLVTYHALFGSLAERKREVGFLDDDLDLDGEANDVMRTVQSTRAGADMLLLGDFNLSKNQLAEALPAFTDKTVGTGSTVNLRDEITSNLYDHLLVPPGQPQLADLAPAEVLDVRSQATSDTFFRSVSDHLPIRFYLGHPSAPHAMGENEAPVVPPALEHTGAAEPEPTEPPPPAAGDGKAPVESVDDPWSKGGKKG